MAIGRISAFSMPQYPVYVPTTETDWIAVHAGRTEIAPDNVYVETEGDWTGVHTSYDDVFIPSEVEEEEPPPDFQAMWNTVYAAGPRDLEHSVISATGSVSAGGTLSFTMQRQEDGPPPTDVRVNVLGTSISTWQKFRPGSLTIDMAVPGMPPGVHTVEVEAYAGGRLVGTTQFTITVAEPPPASVTPPSPEPTADEAPATPPPVPAQGPAATTPAAVPQAPVAQAAPAPVAAAPAPKTPTKPDAEKPIYRIGDVPVFTPQVRLPSGIPIGGQAMASGLGAGFTLAATPAKAPEEGVIPIEEASMGGQGESRHQHRPPNHDGDDDG